MKLYLVQVDSADGRGTPHVFGFENIKDQFLFCSGIHTYNGGGDWIDFNALTVPIDVDSFDLTTDIGNVPYTMWIHNYKDGYAEGVYLVYKTEKRSSPPRDNNKYKKELHIYQDNKSGANFLINEETEQGNYGWGWYPLDMKHVNKTCTRIGKVKET